MEVKYAGRYPYVSERTRAQAEVWNTVASGWRDKRSSHPENRVGSTTSRRCATTTPVQFTGAGMIAFSSVTTLAICSRVSSANIGRETNSDALFSATGNDPLPRFNDL